MKLEPNHSVREMVERGIALQTEDRRQYKRVEKRFTISYCRLENMHMSETPEQEAEILDIGGGGLCFLSENPIELSTQLVILLEFSGWLADMDDWVITMNSSDVGVLRVVGMVVRVAVSRTNPDKFEIGIRFTGRVR